MSLLLNEDFATYTLRHSYLTHIHDGVGERLINLNPAVFNNPAFRAAGWTPDPAAIKRCYSPPIPTTSAATSGLAEQYFRAPRSRLNLRDTGGDGEDADGDVGGGLITGDRGSEDTVGAVDLRVNERKRRRSRKEQLEEEDSSDLSDEDSDSEKERTAAQSIKFAKAPVRRTATKSPSHSYGNDPMLGGEEDEGDDNQGPEVMVTSPSKPLDNSRLSFRPRGSSLSARVDFVKQRARADTVTSSEMSSENEVDPARGAFNRKLPGRPDQKPKKTVMLAERIQEEDHKDLERTASADAIGDSDLEDEYLDEASDLSDEFEAVAEATSPGEGLLSAGAPVGQASDVTSPEFAVVADMPPAIGPHQNQGNSPRKKGTSKEETLPRLAKLPPGATLRRAPAASLISMALKGGSEGPGTSEEKPFQRFADLSGKGEASPLWIKIYAPFSKSPSRAIEVPTKKTRDGNAITIAELIGLALWRYNEEVYDPPLTADPKDSNINRWDLRIVEDEEVDFDFPALVRTRPVTDFTSNNNRPPQRRARDRPWDEFGLVRATEEQFKANEEVTPQIGAPSIPLPQAVSNLSKTAPRPSPAVRTNTDTSVRSAVTPSFSVPHNPITGPTFAPSALRRDTGNVALDAPQREIVQSTPRTGAAKTVTVHFTDPQSFTSTKVTIPTTADTYIAEIFDHACQKLGQEKGLYVLKVHGTQTIAPLDRTVEALGDRLHIDLVRRRFIGAGDGPFGLGLSGSPGSSSPNQPLELVAPGTPGGSGGKKPRKGFTVTSHPTLASSNLNLVGLGLALPPELGGIGGKKYNVLRKQPLSFAPSHPRTLIITPEYMQILPAAPDSLVAPTGKVTNVPMSSVVGVKVSRKHPKMVRVLVYREKETKRYDFEAGSRDEANAIVTDVRRAVE
ncbi:stress-activated map kinase interacting protein 1-domain-containing protein, partial [Neohortaea acidophila]